ncbi:MAG: flagellar hook basal-body protein [Sedimentisphaerales bacterium]|nr:flagellar hook basal-body protein [Sedimentisphaerales bacterium]
MSAITDQVSTSIDALTKEFNIITHNLANVSTVGFKRRCNAFSLSLESQDPESYSPGTIDLNSAFDFSQGGIVDTGRPLDFALHGKGFFVIETPEGPRYTRNGIFNVNQNSQIVDSLGRIVAGQAGPITIPGNVGISQLNVSDDGTISAGEIAIGKFRLVDFNDNENKLLPTGDSCYRMPDVNVQPADAENIVVKQGYQEASNVQIIDELVDMILVSRLYEANMKSITAAGEASSSLMSVAMG